MSSAQGLNCAVGTAGSQLGAGAQMPDSRVQLGGASDCGKEGPCGHRSLEEGQVSVVVRPALTHVVEWEILLI